MPVVRFAKLRSNVTYTRRTIAFVVAMVLADSAIVILALPAIYREFDVTVAQVAWVVIAFNLTLALTAIPAAMLVRRIGAARQCSAGLVGLAVSSLACALAPSLAVLIAARAVQGIAGAVAVCAALELLPLVADGDRGAARSWAAAGIAGAALGPAVGGLLTQLFSWQAIFAVQVPLTLVPIVIIGFSAERAAVAPAGRPHLGANAALALLSAGLTAALFLIVLLLIEGWRLAPLAAALVVTVLPAASIATAPLERRLGSARVRATAGALVGAGGLAALGLMPAPGWLWTVPAQILVGVGLALSLGALTESALAGRSRPALHGGATIASRHAGIVLGLLLLTPVFVADLDVQSSRAKEKGVELVIDSDVAPVTKLRLAAKLASDVQQSSGRLPDVRRSIESLDAAPSQRPALDALATRLERRLDDAATSSFSRSFLFAALLALLGLVPIALTREVRL